MCGACCSLALTAGGRVGTWDQPLPQTWGCSPALCPPETLTGCGKPRCAFYNATISPVYFQNHFATVFPSPHCICPGALSHREAHAPAARGDSGLPRATLLARAGQGTLASLCRRKMPGATRLLSAMWVLKGDASCFLAIHSRVWQLPPVL